jgi:hypothetical protein
MPPHCHPLDIGSGLDGDAIIDSLTVREPEGREVRLRDRKFDTTTSAVTLASSWQEAAASRTRRCLGRTDVSRCGGARRSARMLRRLAQLERGR